MSGSSPPTGSMVGIIDVAERPSAPRDSVT